MDSQMNSELLNKVLEDDMISLRGGESDVDLLGPDLSLDLQEDLDTKKRYSIIDELMDGPPTHHTKYQHSTNTTTSTIFSTVSHPLSTRNTTTTHSTINTTSFTPTAGHNDTRHNTTPAHTRITTTTNKSPTTHILKNTTSTLPLPYHPHPHHHHYAHPQKHLLYQPHEINHPQPRQKPKLHLPNIQFHHLNTCLSPFTPSPIAPTTFPDSIYP